MASTTTILAASAGLLRVGESLTLTATVEGDEPSGLVTFKSGAAVLGTDEVSGGVATFVTSALAFGTHNLSAQYAGDMLNDPSSSESVLFQVRRALSATALVSRIASLVTFEQADPSTTWVIPHNMHGYPIVDVYVNFGGDVQKILPTSLQYTDQDTVTINFTNAYSGYATVV